MKKNILLMIGAMLCLETISMAQQGIGIGINSPNASALLDIKSSNKGLLIPRVSLVSERCNI